MFRADAARLFTLKKIKTKLFLFGTRDLTKWRPDMTNPDITPAGIAEALGKLADRQWRATYDPADYGWWNVSAPWECEGESGMDTIDESGDGGFEKTTADAIAYALTALPLIGAKLAELEWGCHELEEREAKAIADKEAAEKRVAELEAEIADLLADIREGR